MKIYKTIKTYFGCGIYTYTAQRCNGTTAQRRIRNEGGIGYFILVFISISFIIISASVSFVTLVDIALIFP